MEPIVIIGAGLAGYGVARELRKLDKEVPLVLICADSGDFYSKPMLSNALANGKDGASLVNTPAEKMAAQLNLRLISGVRVQGIDRDRRQVSWDGGEQTYSRLVLATGADPIRLPLQGDGADSVLSVNDLGDYVRFRDQLAGGRRVAILGGGLIGCEFANDLVKGGYAPTIYDPSPLPLGRLLPPGVASFFRDRLGAAGVTWQLEDSVARVEGGAGAYRLTTAQGKTEAADVVLSAVGLRPRLDLARETGLAVNRGIVVDRYLASSDANIFALGDGAEVAGLVLPFVLPIMQASRALAATLAGTPTAVAYPAMPVAVKTPACPVVVCPPAPGAQGRWEEIVDTNGARALFLDGAGGVLGFALAGDRVQEKQALALQVPPVLV